jgi:hypothetical protein
MLSKKLAAIAAISMITASSAAVAQTAAPSVAASTVRAGAPTEGSNELVGTTAWILAAIALGLIVWGVIELTDDDGPSSP